MDIKSIRQFKLSNGDEIVCDVVEWPSVDDEHDGLVIRNAYKIHMIMPLTPTENRYYQFRPWMVYQDNPEYFQILNAGHILSEATPSEEMLIQYQRLLNDEEEDDIEKMTAKLKEMLVLVNAEEVDLYGDSDLGSKIVKFPVNRKLH